jgi:hypothetical protein
LQFAVVFAKQKENLPILKYSNWKSTRDSQVWRMFSQTETVDLFDRSPYK